MKLLDTADTKPARRFYVYLLFDHLGLPRYVGKGTAHRWLQHERRSDARNVKKNSFIEQTTRVLGEVPKIKIRENLTETEAFALEIAFIKAIGRCPRGPLCNMTDGGDGLDSAAARAREAAQTPELRSARQRKANAALTPEQRSEVARAREAAKSPEQRCAAARKANAALTPEQHSERSRVMHAALTPEQRSATMRKTQAARSSEQRSAAARKGNAALTPEQRSESARKANAARTPEQRRAAALKGVAAQTPEQRRAKSLKAAGTMRARAAANGDGFGAASNGVTALPSAPQRPTARRGLDAPRLDHD